MARRPSRIGVIGSGMMASSRNGPAKTGDVVAPAPHQEGRLSVEPRKALRRPPTRVLVLRQGSSALSLLAGRKGCLRVARTSAHSRAAEPRRTDVTDPEEIKRSVKVCMFDQYGTVVDMQTGLWEVAVDFLKAKGWKGNPYAFVT